MTEAAESLRLTQLRASMGIAINVRARQMALNATKDHLRRQGFRVSQFTQRDLRVRAESLPPTLKPIAPNSSRTPRRM
jgi:hypothetical protein